MGANFPALNGNSELVQFATREEQSTYILPDVKAGHMNSGL
jgi:hypothetical protein